MAGEAGRMRVCPSSEAGTRENRIEHALAIPQHLMVPEAKHFPALTGEIGVADFVASVLRMLRSVGLDDQSRSDAQKIDNIRPDRNLPAKLETALGGDRAGGATGDARRRWARGASRGRGRAGSRRRPHQSSCAAPDAAASPPPSSVAPSARHLPPEGEGIPVVPCSPSGEGGANAVRMRASASPSSRPRKRAALGGELLQQRRRA